MKAKLTVQVRCLIPLAQKTERCLTVKCILVLATYAGVSLITGLEYGIEQWNGKWNGTVNVHNYS